LAIEMIGYGKYSIVALDDIGTILDILDILLSFINLLKNF
jgi:hypothetical protein